MGGVMLHPVRVDAGQLFRYTPKGQELGAPVPPGQYLATFSRVEKTKRKAVGGICATDANRSRVYNLFPDELYVRRVLTGVILEDAADFGRAEERELQLFATRPHYPWQEQALLDMQSRLRRGKPYRRSIICPVGGGKTLFGLQCAAPFLKAGARAVVAAPRHLFYDWGKDAKKWDLPCPEIMTYEALAKVKDNTVSCLILDEAFAVSNPDTHRFRHAKRIAAQAQVAISMTGTPRSIGPQQLRWVGATYPGIIPETDTAFRFCYSKSVGTKEIMPGRTVYTTDEWDLAKLLDDLHPILVTVDASEIERLLPPMTVERIMIPRFRRWEQIAKGAACASGSKPKIRAQALTATDGHVEFEDGRCLDVDDSKLKAAAEMIAACDDAVLVVAHWRRTQERLAQMLSEYNPAVVGDFAGVDSDEGRRRFDSGDTRILICSASMALGMNLQDRCHVGIVLSNSSSPIMRTQLLGRLRRPGQTKPVRFYDLLMEGTLDARRLDLLEQHVAETEEFIDLALDREIGALIGE